MIGSGQLFQDPLEDGYVEFGQMRLVLRLEKTSKLLLTMKTETVFSFPTKYNFTFITGQNLHGGTVQPR